MMKTASWEYQKGTWTFKFGDAEPVVIKDYDLGYQIFKQITGLEDKWNQMVNDLHLVALDLKCGGESVQMCCHTCNDLSTGVLNKETNEVTCLRCRQTEVYDAEVK